MNHQSDQSQITNQPIINTLQKNENNSNEQDGQILRNLTTQSRQISKYESTPFQTFRKSTNETISEMINSQCFLTEKTNTNIPNDDNTAVHMLPTSDDIGM